MPVSYPYTQYGGIWKLNAASAAQGAGTWPSKPGAPTIGTAIAGTQQASVAFIAPSNTGIPSGISSYTATSSPGGFTASGASSPITVTGLATGTPYTFTVKANGSSGLSSDPSAASNSVTPT